MRRAVLIAALVALALPGAARAQAPPLRAKLAACLSGPQPSERTAVFTGSMPAITGTRRMWMRFDLLASTSPAGTFAPLKVPGLGIWQKSAPGRAAGFVFTQRVQALVAPGAYQAVVRFRWYGAGGKLLRVTKRATGVCKQPDERADLHAGLLTAVPGPRPDQATYTLMVANNGRGDAAPFDVALDVAGVEQPAQRVADGLRAGARRTLTFVAARCAPGSTVRLTVDAREEVDEVDEVRNVAPRVCPLVA
jgi:CARDB